MGHQQRFPVQSTIRSSNYSKIFIANIYFINIVCSIYQWMKWTVWLAISSFSKSMLRSYHFDWWGLIGVECVRWDNIISMRYIQSRSRSDSRAGATAGTWKLSNESVTKNRLNTDSVGLSAAVISRTAGCYLYFPFVSRSVAYDQGENYIHEHEQTGV